MDEGGGSIRAIRPKKLMSSQRSNDTQMRSLLVTQPSQPSQASERGAAAAAATFLSPIHALQSSATKEVRVHGCEQPRVVLLTMPHDAAA